MIPKTLFRVGLITTDYLVKKSGVLGSREEKAEFINNLAGSDVYYLYNKYIEKLTPEEFFKMYFNSTISHISDKNIKQLRLAKRISPSESKDYLAEMYSLISKLMTESTVVESAGSSKCFRHPVEDFLFIIEDSQDNVSLYIQSEDLQNYLTVNDMGNKMNTIPGRVTRRFSYSNEAVYPTRIFSITTYDDPLIQMQSDLSSDYDAQVSLFSAQDDESTGMRTYVFSVTGPEASMLFSDITSYPAWKSYSLADKVGGAVGKVVGTAVRGTASIAKHGMKGVTGELTQPAEAIGSHYTRHFSANDHVTDENGNKKGTYDAFNYTYREMQNISTIKLPSGQSFSREGRLQRPNLDDINVMLQQTQDPNQITQFMESKGFQLDPPEVPQEVEDKDSPNPDIRVESKTFSNQSWRSSGSPFQEKKKNGSRVDYRNNSNREELWNNIVSALDGVSQKELDWVVGKLKGETKKKSDTSEIQLF